MSKEKVGIITYHASHNCGSFLQSYAIENVIRNEFGKEPEIIDFSNEGQQNIYRPFLKAKSPKDIIKNALLFPYRKRIYNVFNCYKTFIESNLTLSKKKYSKLEELDKIENEYDMFVAGSDQIWNILCPDADDAYFLPFIKNKKKIAYAPSFGAKDLRKVTKSEAEMEKYKNYLMNFDYLSSREMNGKRWIEEITSRDVKLVLDPTLILDKKMYKKLERETGITGDYIFYYSPKYNTEVSKLVKEFAKENNLKVIVWNPKQWVLRCKRFGFKTTYDQDPGIYLSLIKNAKYVFTTSFHGAIFSTIYRKNFWIPKVGGMQGDDDRVYTLLNQLGLEDRFLNITDYDLTKLHTPVNYSDYDNRLKVLVESSKKYLKEALS